MDNEKSAKHKLPNFTGYEGKWVILSADETKIIAASYNLDDLHEISAKNPESILAKIPDPRHEYATFFTSD